MGGKNKPGTPATSADLQEIWFSMLLYKMGIVMRSSLLVLAVLLLIACGSDSPTKSPSWTCNVTLTLQPAIGISDQVLA